MIHLEEIGSVTVVRMAHGKVNALDVELLAELRSVFGRLAGGESTAIVLTGTGAAFSAGVDLRRVIDGGSRYIGEFLPALSDTVEAIFNIGKPVVAAVNGYAIAGGCILMCCCDHRVATNRSVVGVTELQVGVPFPPSALEILSVAVGDIEARQAIFSGAVYESEESWARGFVDEVVKEDDLLPRALTAALRLSAIPADVYALTKQQLRYEINVRLRERRRVEDDHVAELWNRRAADGGLRAFMEKIAARSNTPVTP